MKLIGSSPSGFLCSSQMSSKPPLCCWLIILRAAELRIGRPIKAETIFARNRARRWIELTASMRTIDVQAPCPICLPEPCRLVHSLVISDADKLYLLTLPISNAIDNVEIFEVSSNVISKIHTVGWVTACCSPVSGVTLQGCHSCQTQYSGTASSSGRSRSLESWLWMEYSGMGQGYDETGSKTSPGSKQCRALTENRNKLENCCRWSHTVCTHHNWNCRRLAWGSPDRRRDEKSILC